MKKRPLVKLIVLFFAILLAVAVTGVFIYRYEIIRRSVETIIRNVLPPYATIDAAHVDIKNSKLVIDGFKVLNPPGFSGKYLLTVKEFSLSYKLLGKTFLDGVGITDIVFEGPRLEVERLKDGRLNLGEFMKEAEKTLAADRQKKATRESKKKASFFKVVPDKALRPAVKLPESFAIKDGEAVFSDSLPYGKPYVLSLGDARATVTVRLNEAYTKVMNIATQGEGSFNKNKDQMLKWVVSCDTTADKLTMSNRLEASGVDIVALKPYYDKHSPFIIQSGKFTGTLIFDFDHGNIGSTNEVRLANLAFSIKPGYEDAQALETSVRDLAKYFTSSYGEVVFDFKIKGDMAKPTFYLGPISKRAITAMVVDKISSALQQAAGKSQPSPADSGPKTDMDKAQEYIDLIKGMIKKK